MHSSIIRNLLKNFTALCLFGGLAMAGLLTPMRAARAQDAISPWEAAATIRDETLRAQQALLSGDDSDAAPAAVSAARAAYAAAIQPKYAQVAPEAEAWLAAAWHDAISASESGDAPALASARGRLWTGLLWGAQLASLDAVYRGNGADAMEWLRLREYRRATRISLVHDRARDTTSAWMSGQGDAATAMAVAGDDLRDTYFYRLREALTELGDAVDKGYATRAAEWAGRSRGYFAIIKSDFAAKQGDAAATELAATLSVLEDMAISEDLMNAAANLERVREQVANYQPVQLSSEELAQRSQLLYLFVDLVYSEYKDGVRDGAITIDTEYQEAVTFLNQAEVFTDELYPQIAAADGDAAERLVALLGELDDTISSLGDKGLVQDQVDEALALIQATLGDSVGDGSGSGVFVTIDTLLNEMEKQVAVGDYELAESTRIQAYALFDAGPELRLMAFSPEMVARLDGHFWAGYAGAPGLAQVIAQERSAGDVSAVRDRLSAGLAEAEDLLSHGAAPAAVVMNAAVIVFREGLEAVVILAALMASMVGAYAIYRRPMVWGVLSALVATAATWWIAQRLLVAFSGFGEKLEAVVSLLAVGVLLLITNWFFHRVYWKDWMKGFHQRKRRILGGSTNGILAGQAIGFALLGFSSVYREGFETVLFLQALVLEAGAMVVLYGVALGMLGVAAVGLVTFRLQKRLPYKKMLVVTGVLIGGVLLVLVGNTIHTMQAVGWVPITPVGSISIPYWMGLWFGVYPTWETLIGQGAAAAFVIGSYYLAEHQQTRRRRSVTAAENAERAAHAATDSQIAIGR